MKKDQYYKKLIMHNYLNHENVMMPMITTVATKKETKQKNN